MKGKSSDVVKVKEEAASGKKRKSRGSLDIGKNLNKLFANKGVNTNA